MKTPFQPEPPKWVSKFLDLLLEPRALESSLGDLEEKFRRRLINNTPKWKAKCLYVLEGLGFLKMVRFQKKGSTQTTFNMMQHTFLFFTRQVRRNFSYYLVSMFGLALSLASFILIMMFVSDELAYDQFHSNHNRIFRLTTHLRLNDVDYNEATCQFPAAEALKSEIPEVEYAVRIYPQDLKLEVGDKKFEEHILLADKNFFEVFTFPMLFGDVKTAMSQPGSIILTRATAKKYFGDSNPVGKTVLIYGHTIHVTGVMENVPVQSHMKFDAIIPLSLQLNIWKSQTGLEGRENKWFWTGAFTYVQLKSNADAEKAKSKLPIIVDKYFPDRYKEKGRFELQPLDEIHLKSNLDGEMEPGGSMTYLRLFSIVAFVIILVSAINLINLSWFKISSRVREVGIRKFLGQNPVHIVTQFSIESMLQGIVAFMIAIILCRIFLGQFNLLVLKNLELRSAPNIMIMVTTLILVLIISCIAVFRPVMRYAARSSNSLILKKYKSPAVTRVRNVLIGLQVCFSFVLLAFSFVISGQISFFLHKDLGFDKEDVIIVELNEDINSHLEAFKNELKKKKSIINIAGGEAPGSGINGWRFVPEGGSYEKPFMFPLSSVDYDFLNTLNIKLLIGENFKPDNKADSLVPFIINRRAAIDLGWIDDPLDRTLEIFAPGQSVIMAKGRIIGLIDDYHFESLHKPVKPLVLTLSPDFGTALIKVSGDSYEEAIADIGNTWKKFSNKPFVYEPLDKKLEKLYTNETKLSHVIIFFTFIALYLTCYGMFSMSSLLFRSRLKEVAIRKVFGADQLTIVKHFYSRYVIFNLVAIIIGLPLAIWIGNQWLQTFQYRIELGSEFFIKAGVYILFIGLLSVSYYLIRVAVSSPIRFLRNE